MSSSLRAACLEYEDGTYKLLNFQPQPDHDLRRSAELEGLKYADRPFIVYSIIPKGVDGLRYVDRRNAGLSTSLVKGEDGRYCYQEWTAVNVYTKRWKCGERA